MTKGRKVCALGMAALMAAGSLTVTGVEQVKADDVVTIKIHTPIPEQTDSDAVMAVSYTHLDVYKRQVLQPSGGSSCNCRSSGDRYSFK